VAVELDIPKGLPETTLETITRVRAESRRHETVNELDVQQDRGRRSASGLALTAGHSTTIAKPSAPRPNVLLIGAPRCASTSLAFALEEHPDIYLCNPKEPHFLAMHGRETEINGIGSEAFSKNNWMTYQQWTSLFRDKKERYLLDASVSTMSYPNTSITNILKYCGNDTKIIVILRNPVERAYSSHQYCLSRGWPAGTFDEGLESEQFRIENNWQHLWFLKSMSQYELRLKPFLDAFGRDNIHIAITEEFSDDPNAVLRGIFEFLDLPIVKIDTSVRYNPSGVPSSRLVGDASAFIRKRPALLKGLKLFSTRLFREAVKSRSLRKTEMADATRRSLVAALSETRPWVEDLIGRKLAAWD